MKGGVLKIKQLDEYCLIPLGKADLAWHSPAVLGRLSLLKSYLLSASYIPKKKIIFLLEEDVIEAPYLLDYQDHPEDSSRKIARFLDDWIEVLHLVKSLHLECFFFSSYHVVGFSWLLGALSSQRFLAPGKVFGFYTPELSLFPSEVRRDEDLNHKHFFELGSKLIEENLAAELVHSSSELSSCLKTLQAGLKISSFSPLLTSLYNSLSFSSSLQSLYQGNFFFLPLFEKGLCFQESKKEEVYINLNGKMLPFRGLSNLLEAGFELFFFSKNKPLMKARLEAFKSYLEETLGAMKSDFYFKEKIYSLETSSIGSKKIVFARKSVHLIEISRGLKAQFYCLVPSLRKKKKVFLLGELATEAREKSFPFSYASYFFDSLVKSRDKERDTYFLSLILYKVILRELKSLAFLFGEKVNTVVSSLQGKGLLCSFSKENSKLVNSLISDLELSRWFCDHFELSHDVRRDYKASSREFNSELAVLHMKTFLTLIMAALVRRSYFPSFLSCEYYLRQVLAIKDSEESLQVFLEEIGPDKFSYFVWQFFPEYLNSLSFLPKNEPFVSLS